MKCSLKQMLIMLTIGFFISAQQIHAEAVQRNENPLDLNSLVITSPDLGEDSRPVFIPTFGDTIETYDIELEEKKDSATLYKEVAAFVIAAAMVTFIVVTLLEKDEEEDRTDRSGKDFPPVGQRVQFYIPFTRL